MKHLYELAKDYDLKIGANYFTDLYIIERKFQNKRASIIDILNFVYIINTANRGGSFKKVFNCLNDFFKINNIEVKII